MYHTTAGAMRREEGRAIRAAGALMAIALAACAGFAPEPLPPAPPLSAERIAADVAWLAADAREGRGLGTRGLEEAAAYVAEAFREAGLAPGAADGTYLQPFEMPIAIEVTEAELSVDGEALARGEDFAAFVTSGSGAAAGEVVFVGYGISAPRLDYDDFAGVDVVGRIVLALDDRPEGEATPLAGPKGAPFLRRADKLANARRAGATAVLLAPPGDIAGLPGDAGDETASPTTQSSDIVALAVRREVAERLVAAAGGPTLAERQASIDATGRPGSAPLPGTRVAVRVEVERRRGTVSNAIGVLEGSDPELRREAVVIGAHYDHLGRGEFGSLAPGRRGEVHNGADDNASGTAGLLELARAFASGPRPRRTLVFVAFGGEEAGLVGSHEYVQSPTVPLEDTVAMINLDMIGRLGDRPLTVFGGDTSPGFPGLVRRAAEEVPLGLAFGEGGYAPSDQTSFYARDVPVLFFFTGSHGEYHTPDDDAELVDADGTARVLRVVYRAARALAESGDRPRVIAAEPPPTGGGPGYGPYLGTVPDFADSGGERGVELQGVRPGSPAELAGLRAGDRLVEFDGASVANLEEFAALLFNARPGRRVGLVVVRDGERIQTEATLGQRR